MSNAARNFTQLFKTEQDIWVRSLVPGQVSVSFNLGQGEVKPVTVPYSHDPIRLTDQVPFEAIKNSTDLRHLASPRRTSTGGYKPPALMIMSEAEADDFFRKKALKKGLFVRDIDGNVAVDEGGNPLPDLDAARAPTFTEAAVRQPATRVETTTSKSEEAMDAHSDISNLGNQPVRMVEQVHPRVLHICNELRAAESPNDRMTADAVRDEFEALGTLSEDSLGYIQANGYYKTVKKWAEERLSSLYPGEED